MQPARSDPRYIWGIKVSTMAVHHGLFPQQTAVNAVSQSTAQGGWCFVIQIQTTLWCEYLIAWTKIKKMMCWCMSLYQQERRGSGNECRISTKCFWAESLPVQWVEPHCSDVQPMPGGSENCHLFSMSSVYEQWPWLDIVCVSCHFPPTILLLVVLIFQCCCITSGPMNDYIFACQFTVSSLNIDPSIINLFLSSFFLL